MKLKLNKTHLKNLTQDKNLLPEELTPKVAGAGPSAQCQYSDKNICYTARGNCDSPTDWC